MTKINAQMLYWFVCPTDMFNLIFTLFYFPNPQFFCLLSALLFVLSVEIMALLIRNNKDITGFQIKIDEQTHGIKISGWHNTVFNSKNDNRIGTPN
jgi:hypothetical protein